MAKIAEALSGGEIFSGLWPKHIYICVLHFSYSGLSLEPVLRLRSGRRNFALSVVEAWGLQFFHLASESPVIKEIEPAMVADSISCGDAGN